MFPRILAFFFWLAAVVMGMAGEEAVLIKRGDASAAQHQTAQALEAYLAAEKLAPENAEVLHRIAREYGLTMAATPESRTRIDIGRKALQYAQRAVTVDPRSASANLELAIAYGRLAEVLDNKTKIEYSKKIEEYARRSLELDPQNDAAWYVLGAWNYGLANVNPLMRALASAVYGSLPAASNEKAVEYLQKAVSLNPNRVGSRVDLGRALIALGEKEKGRAELQKALALPSRGKDDDSAKEKAQAALQ